MTKIERLLMEILLLKNEGRMTAERLSRRLGVHIRTVYRDMDALSQMDIPIFSVTGQEGGYELVEDYFLPALHFTSEEALSLLLARKLIGQTGLPGYSDVVESAFLKIENSLKDTDKARLERLSSRILFDFASLEPDMEGKGYLPLIREGFEKGRKLLVDYYSPRRDLVRRRTASPLVLSFSDGGWYLVARVDGKDGLWWFRLDRIRALTLSADEAAGEEASPEVFRRESLYRKGADEPGEPLVIGISASLYRIIRDDLFLKYARIEEDKEEIRVFLPPYFREEALRLLVENPEQIRPIGPESFLDDLQTLFSGILNKMKHP